MPTAATDLADRHPAERALAAGARVRPLAPSDLERIVEIDARLTGEAKLDYWTAVLANFLARGRHGRVGLAAEIGGRVQAYLLGELRAFEFGSEPCGWVFAVGVDPDAARQGLSTLLLEEACRRFRAAGVARVRTMVRRNDVPLLSFFRSNRFRGGAFVQLERSLEEG